MKDIIGGICWFLIKQWIILGSQVLNRYHTWEQIYAKMAQHCSTRWAFNTSNWKPTHEEMLLASGYIQTEEKLRIARFVYQDDVKSSLIGRLLLRKYVHECTKIPYNDILFTRDAWHKPVLKGFENSGPFFNVSHQGDYVVLAGDTRNKIGIDVMKIEPPVNKNIPEFFRIMTRQFSVYEWNTIKSYTTEEEQAASFYRHWCLKESYVKNIGLGVTLNLRNISFSVKTPVLNVGELVTDSKLYIENHFKPDWVFEETLLDKKHVVAVAVELTDQSTSSTAEYEFLTFQDIVANAAVPLHDSDTEFVNDFFRKDVKGF